jgi:serine/threonine protein kinase
LKASIAHRVKRESFVRMSVENISQKYKFSKKVGQGAYGSVFIAKSKKMDEQKAIKII